MHQITIFWNNDLSKLKILNLGGFKKLLNGMLRIIKILWDEIIINKVLLNLN